MSFLKVFQQLAVAIIDDPVLTEKEREGKIVRLADMCNFIENYDPVIQIIDHDHDQFCIVEERGMKKAIVICDFAEEVRGCRSNQAFNQTVFTSFKDANQLMEVWLVIVEEGIVDSHLNECRQFIQGVNIHQFCDKVFHFSYSDFLIKQLI